MAIIRGEGAENKCISGFRGVKVSAALTLLLCEYFCCKTFSFRCCVWLWLAVSSTAERCGLSLRRALGIEPGETRKEFTVHTKSASAFWDACDGFL